MDIVNRGTRSRIMSRIRSSDNKSTERRFKAYMARSGISGWVLRDSNVYGKPDFSFRKSQLAVFVDGCFWHGCRKCGRPPHSNLSYWDNKLKRNKARDGQVTRKLRKEGWKVIRFWEHEILFDPKKSISKLVKATTECKAS